MAVVVQCLFGRCDRGDGEQGCRNRCLDEVFHRKFFPDGHRSDAVPQEYGSSALGAVSGRTKLSKIKSEVLTCAVRRYTTARIL